MKIYLGRTSNNEPVLKEIAELPVLFLVYNHKTQWDKYLADLFLINEQIQAMGEWTVFRIISRYHVINLAGGIEFRHLIELEEYINNKMRNTGKPDAVNPNILLLIDDIFQLKLFDNRKAAKFLLKLIDKGEQYHIYLLIGTIGLFRGLLYELIHFSNTKGLPDLYTRFSELVINEDDLVFFREKMSGTFTRYF